MKTILVPISSFENGLKTLQYAVDFAAHISAKIYVLKVYGANVIAGSIKTVGPLLEENSKAELKNLIQNINKKDVEIIATTMRGTLVDCIHLILENVAIDLIISTSNRIAKDETIYIGKITGNIIENIDCPVLVVPENYEFKKIVKVLMAIKSGIIKRENVLKPLSSILELFNAKLNLFQVITPNLHADGLNINAELSALTSSIETSENATIYQGVLEHLHEVEPDLMCVIRRKKGFFSKIWSQHTVKKVDFESRVPLLVLKGAF